MISEVAQSCPTLWDPVDSSPPGSSVHWILQARILKWVALLQGGLPDPGIDLMSLMSPALQADSLSSEPTEQQLKNVTKILVFPSLMLFPMLQ